MRFAGCLRVSLLLSGLLLVTLCRAGEVAPFRLAAGDLPPFAIERGSASPGALGEMVGELALRLGKPANIEFYPWARALSMAETQSRVAVLPLTRMPDREKKYRWLVKLYRQNFVFISRSNAGFDLQSLPVMRNKRVAVLRASPSMMQLQQQKFGQLVVANSVDDMARMLKRDMVDALYGSETIALHKLHTTGLPRDQLAVGPVQASGDIWLGGSLDFTEADVAAWQEAMRTLVRDGTYSRILKRYNLPE